MAYPTSFDSFTAQVDGVDQADAADINSLQSAIVAIETYLGITATADNTTIGYKLKNAGSQDPGHTHTKNSIVTVTEAQVEDGSLLARLAANESVGGRWTFSDYMTFTGGYGQLPSNAAHLVISAGGVSGGNRATMLFGDIGAADKLIIGTKNGGALAAIMTLTSNVKSVNFAGDIGSASTLCIRPGDNASNHTQLSAVVDILPTLGGATPYITLNGTGASALSAKVGIGVGTGTQIGQVHVKGLGPTDAGYASGFAAGAQLLLQDSGNSIGSGGGVVFGTANGYHAAIKASLAAGTANTFGDLVFALRAATGFGTDAAFTEYMRLTSVGFCGVGTAVPLTQLTVAGASGYVGIDGTAVAVPVGLSGWKGGTLFLTDNSATSPKTGYGGMLLFGTDAVHAAAIKYVQSNGSANTRGHLTFNIRQNAADASLTELMRLYSSGSAIGVGILTTTPEVPLHVNGIMRATQIGVNRSDPMTALHVNGDVAMTPVDVVATTQIDELDPGSPASVIRLTGTLADDFALTGIKYQEAGKFVVVINATNRQITLCHEHSGSGNTKRLYLSELANLTLGGTSGLSVATFLYTVTPLGSRWLLVSARSNSAVASTRAK